MKMKLLCINNGYPTKQNPQYTTYIQTIANCLEKSGFFVDLFVVKFNSKITLFYKVIKYIQFWVKALFVDLKNYDIIYINHLPFVWTILFNKSLENKKVFVHWHGNDLVSKTRFMKCCLNLIKNRGVGFKHITPSLYFKSKLVQIMGYNSNDIFVSPSGGVDVDLFKPLSKKKDDNKFVIAYAAGLQKDKGAEVLLSLLKRKDEIEKVTNKKIIFKAIDYGKEVEYYKEQFKSFSNSIDIVDKVPKCCMPNFYYSTDILIMPSIREGESLGLVVLEAMSCNIPVVTHNICAFSEFVIPSQSGELVCYSDDLKERIDNFINALLKIINNYDQYSPRNIILEKYSEESVIESYKNILRC